MGGARGGRRDRRRPGRPRRRLRAFLDRRAARRDRRRSTSPARPGSGSSPSTPTALGAGAALGAVARRRALPAPLPAAARSPTSSGPGRCRSGRTAIAARRAAREPRRAARAAAAAPARPRDRAPAGAPRAARRPRAAAAAGHLAAARAPGSPGSSSPNPLGLAAGFDKNAEAVGAAARAPASASSRSAPRRRCRSRATRGRGSSGWPRTGRRSTASASTTTASPRSPPGWRPRPPGGVVGLNLGANKASADRAADYAAVLAAAGPLHRLRHGQRLLAQHRAAARPAGRRGAARRSSPASRRPTAALARPVPVFLKIAPDLDRRRARGRWSRWRSSAGVAGIVATNTTLARDGLREPARRRGRRPLRAAALRAARPRVLARVHALTDGPAAADRRRRRRLGRGRPTPRSAPAPRRCSSIPRWSTSGLALVPRILAGLDALLARDGFASVAEAVGTGRDTG